MVPKMSNNYIVYHLHSDYSLLDSCTKFKDYVDRAVELGQKAIGSTEHGNIYNWIEKKMYCDKVGIKYLHGCEVYLTEKLVHKKYNEDTKVWEEYKVRDNYHTVLIAKNWDGVKELNMLVSISNQPDHKYYKPRLSFDEFLNISDNIIKISACLASPLNTENPPEKLLEKYDYYEIQYHNVDEQIKFNQYLYKMSKKYNKPLIVGTDTHALNKYKSECRNVLQKGKTGALFGTKKGEQNADFNIAESEFDLTYKSYDELVEMFAIQGSLPMQVVLAAIENTNTMADSVEDFTLDLSIKYPDPYDDSDKVLIDRIKKGLIDKLKSGIIPITQKQQFIEDIQEEIRVFRKVHMMGFMLSMSDICRWAKNNGHPIGFNRGSVGGSRIAYVVDIIDLNPITWNTSFSRFCNEDREEVGDIDIDVYKEDRPFIYEYIINRFGVNNTAHVLALGTVSDKGTIDLIGRALEYNISLVKQIKEEYDINPDNCRKKYSELFYYFDGILNSTISQSMHAAGIVASPITLADNYGLLTKDKFTILQLDMDCVHECGLVKYDILGLKNIGIIKKACEYAHIKYPKSNEINWNDEKVWNDMIKSPVAIFQFESAYAFKVLKDFKPKSIEDMALVTAMIRPSGDSYRDSLVKRIKNKNPSKIIDELLQDNYGYLVYQEDVINFLQKVCGMSGSEADNVRRAIGRKDIDRLHKALPEILEGYCEKSDKTREVAEKEAKDFLQIIEDASSYMFGRNHAIGYCMLGYLCAYFRYYYPYEFLTAFLNCSETEEDISQGTALAKLLNIKVIEPKFRYARSHYSFDKENKLISKGMSSIKYMNKKVAEDLYRLRDNRYNSFVDVLKDINNIRIDERKLDILILLDFFSEFGNSKTLMTIKQMYNFFKKGSVLELSKDKCYSELDSTLHNIIKMNSTETKKKYKNLNIDTIIKESEKYIIAQNLPDYSFKEKIKNQLDYLGYINLFSGSTDEKERRKVVVLDIKPLKKKSNKAVWGYAVETQSLGSGKKGRFTLLLSVYDKSPIKTLDIIYLDNVSLKKDYWYINNYHIIE